jgi:hypothetical protein
MIFGRSIICWIDSTVSGQQNPSRIFAIRLASLAKMLKIYGAYATAVAGTSLGVNSFARAFCRLIVRRDSSSSAGSRWSGQFAPKGGGAPVARVLIGRYGDRPFPRIDGEGKCLDTVLLKSISFIEVSDLEMTNNGPRRIPWRTGITVLAGGIGIFKATCSAIGTGNYPRKSRYPLLPSWSPE